MFYKIEPWAASLKAIVIIWHYSFAFLIIHFISSKQIVVSNPKKENRTRIRVLAETIDNYNTDFDELRRSACVQKMHAKQFSALVKTQSTESVFLVRLEMSW
jgi:hypothetical protein